MRLLRAWALAAAALVTPTVASAQASNRPGSDDPCSPVARAVARFAARTSRWYTPLPVARRVASLGTGQIWLVVDNPACCGRAACSGSSERADTLVGDVQGRLFALTPARPPRPRPSFTSSTRPYSMPPAGWSAFIAASGATPVDTDSAIALARRIVASIWPELAAVGSPEDLASVALGNLAGRISSPQATAVARAGGWDVSCWMSALAAREPGTNLRDRGSGTSSDMLLVRVDLRIDPDGRVRIVDAVDNGGSTGTVTAPVPGASPAP